MKKPILSYNKILILLAVSLAAAMIGSVTLGRYPISLKELAGILASRFWEIEPFWTKTQESLLLQHRLPRILLACMVGGCLSCAGAAYQGVFQNPMAAPDILGASSGAAFGAALAILLKLSGSWIIVLAFCGSIVTVILVMFVANRAKGRRVLGLILAGIMVSSLISSGTSLIKLVADPEDQLPAITYWLMGSLNGTSPKDVLFALVPMALGLLPLFLLRWRINLLTLGDEEARTMGVNARRLRTATILSATLITAAAVSVSGVIGWVGLVIPHLTRRMVGNNYRHLIPASTLFGGVFLLMVDNLSRNLFTAEIPIGILTSFIGAPFFLYLITREGERL
ncbi:MAG: iron ABC transporter permease [Oscillospiraceae bacterium]|nr:iron ABC transporter permease [Oscillospiraceae bacterium]